MMKHLNYFHPYSKPREKENSLTRAFMSLLRLCPPVRQGFYNMIRDQAILRVDSPSEFPPYYGLNDLKCEIDAQRQELPITSRYLSVLISGEKVELSRKIEPLNRGKKAQYDGLFTIDDLTLFIENKPYNAIIETQLCPHEKDLKRDGEYHLYEFTVNITWRDILSYLNKLQEEESSSNTQSVLVMDFLNFVDEQFSILNPFNKFHLCNSRPLRQRRMHQLLEDITKENTEVGWHRGWGLYIGTAQHPSLGKVGLNYWTYKDESSGEDRWSNNLSFVIADTITQARAFFENGSIDLQALLGRKNQGWSVKANFHIGFMQQNLVHFDTNNEYVEDYLKYWKSTPIKQVKAQEGQPNVFTAVNQYLEELAQQHLIVYNDAKKQEVEDAFGGDRKRSTANIRPGFFVGRNYESEELIQLDRKDQLEGTLKRDINHFFKSLTGETADFIS